MNLPLVFLGTIKRLQKKNIVVGSKNYRQRALTSVSQIAEFFFIHWNFRGLFVLKGGRGEFDTIT